MFGHRLPDPHIRSAGTYSYFQRDIYGRLSFYPGRGKHDTLSPCAGSFCEPIIRTMPARPAVRLRGLLPLDTHPSNAPLS